MVHVTISLPEALKHDMDEQPDVNWSKVCREAISAHIRLLENPYPEIKAELGEVRFVYQKGKPGLILDLAFKNEMRTQLMLDRILFDVDFIPTPGTTLSVGSSVEVRKLYVPAGKWLKRAFIDVDPDVIFLLDRQLTRPFQCRALITAFFEDFKEAYTISRAVKVPIYDWREFVDLVVKTEKERMGIREKRLSG